MGGYRNAPAPVSWSDGPRSTSRCTRPRTPGASPTARGPRRAGRAGAPARAPRAGGQRRLPRAVDAALIAAGLPTQSASRCRPAAAAKTDRLDAWALARFAAEVQPPLRRARMPARPGRAPAPRPSAWPSSSGAPKPRRTWANFDAHLAWLTQHLADLDAELAAAIQAHPALRARAAWLQGIPAGPVDLVAGHALPPPAPPSSASRPSIGTAASGGAAPRAHRALYVAARRPARSTSASSPPANRSSWP